MVEISKIPLQQEKSSNLKKSKKPTSSKKSFFKTKLFKVLAIVFGAIFCLAICAGGIFFFLAKPLISQASATYAEAQLAYDALKKQDLVEAEAKIKSTKEKIKATQSLYNRFIFVKFIPFAGSYWKDGDRLLKAGDSGLNAAQILIETLNPYADILGFSGEGTFTGGTAEDRVVMLIETLPKVLPKIDDIANDLKEADEQLAQINPNRYPESFRGKQIRPKIVQGQQLLHDAVLATTDAKPVLEVFPALMGYPDMKYYITIFQNDGELRPTGGFMTAYGVLRVDKGRIRAEKSDDIYSLDKKLNSRLKPPDPIAKYLLSADLKTGVVPYYYIRDMNFSPDFKDSMSLFLTNYDKIKNEPKVDGVIAMDTKVLTDLLEVLGPINVPGYGEFTLEPDERCFDIPQIVCELEYIVDEPIPGVKAARKDVLGPMMQEIILKAMGAPKNVWPQLFQTIIKDIDEKHILFYFKEDENQNAAEVFNAAGRIKDFEGDYLHINDANFGGAKSNLFVKQEVEKEITETDDGKLISSLTITYTNPEEMSDCNLERKGGLCLNGILRDYVRIYVPKGSKLIEGLGSEEKFKTGEEFGKTFFEGFFTLRGGGGRAKLVLRYELPDNISLDDYKLLIQKQPGTLNNKYKVSAGEYEEEFELLKDKQIN